VESSVFGAEFVAMKNGIKTCCGLRYKLRMMGVTFSCPTFVYGDNMYVFQNTQQPESVLKKNSNSIFYHAVRESAAMGDVNTSGKAGAQIPQLPLGDESSPWGG
jgi:hypothetical protein